MGYFSTWTERMQAGTRFIAPYSLVAVLFVFGVISFSLPVAGPIKAPFLLMAIYYWAIYRPTLLPVWAVFIAGILMDLISGITTVGISALTFIIVRWIVIDQRRFLMGQSFFVTWIGFMIVDLGSGIFEWVVFCLMSGSWLSFQPLGFSILLGIALFPLISFLLFISHKILPEPHASFALNNKNM